MNKPASLLIVTLTGALVACGPMQSPVDRLPADQSEHDLGSDEQQYQRAQQQVQQDLDALADLELFEVRDMVVSNDMLPGVCYGPCDDDDKRMARFVEQSERLRALVELAQNPDDSMVCYQRATDIVDRSLAAIGELELVHIGGMINTWPENNPRCYNLPCEEDKAVADEANEARATHIWQISESSHGL